MFRMFDKVGMTRGRWRRVTTLESTAYASPEFGDGIYTCSEAAAILDRAPERINAGTVRRWVKSGLAPPTFQFDKWGILSFHDLISLEVVRRLRQSGVSLQRVRRVEQTLRLAHPDRARPLAYETFFTDGASVWVQEFDETDPKLIEVVGRRRDHYVWTDAIASFALEIRFDHNDRRALSWSPSEWVEIDPTVQFGKPVVVGTRIPVQTIGANLTAGTPAQVADWYGLEEAQVIGVRDYLAAA